RRTWDECSTSNNLPAGDEVVRILDVHCALFVHHLNERQLGHRIVESVDHAPISVSRQTSDVGNAICFESLSDDLSHCELHGNLPRANAAAPHILLPVRARSE